VAAVGDHLILRNLRNLPRIKEITLLLRRSCADVAPTSHRRRGDVAPTSRRHRRDVDISRNPDGPNPSENQYEINFSGIPSESTESQKG